MANFDDSSNDSDILSELNNEISYYNRNCSLEYKLQKLTKKFKKACNEMHKLTNRIRLLDELKPCITSPPLFDSLDEHENTRQREKYNYDCRRRDHLQREIDCLRAVKTVYATYCERTANEITYTQCEIYGQSVVLQAYQEQAEGSHQPFVPPQALVNYQQPDNYHHQQQQQQGQQQQQQQDQQQIGDPTEQINLNNLSINQQTESNRLIVTYSEQELIFA